jgi:cytosine/adenosine deaminase-related metal-dependent hydrolase
MTDRRVVEGTVLRGETFDPVEGRVVVEDGRIAAVEEAPTDDPAVVLPAFVNAHTHLGDSVAKEAGEGLDLDALVAPPDGLKHRLLRAADDDDVVAAMVRSLRYMRSTGTGAFVDFRENDVAGVELLRRALDEAETGLDATVLARGSVEAMEAADGVGASGARDADYEPLRRAAREAGKPFGIHAGERDPADVNPALDLTPDHLVHMVHLDEVHLDRLAESAVPVVVCPRSNLVTGVGLPDLAALRARTTVALGTDNAFLDAPSMFREMEFAAKLFDASAREVLWMATGAGAEVAGLDCGVIAEGKEARLLVLDGDSDNLAGAQSLVRAVVRRAGVGDVRETILPED